MYTVGMYPQCDKNVLGLGLTLWGPPVTIIKNLKMPKLLYFLWLDLVKVRAR